MPEAELESAERRLRAINGIARIERAHGTSVSNGSVFGNCGFDVTRSAEFDAALREPRYSFAWAGHFTCEPGCYRLELQPGPAPTLDISLLRVEDDAADAIVAATDRASYLFTTAGPVRRASGQGPTLIDEHNFAPPQAHESPVNCVRLTVHEPLHALRFQHWLERLLRGRGGDVIRLQGCLNFAGPADQVVIRGLHPTIDTRVLEPWGDRVRATQLVLVGRGLAHRDLLWSLRGCSA